VRNRRQNKIQITRAAERDIAAIWNWSLKEFGEDAALRYHALMTQAVRDVAADPERPGVQQRSELAEGILIYHLRFSRDGAKTLSGVVRNPRHFVIYRRREGHLIEILRILHDSRDLVRHMPRGDAPQGSTAGLHDWSPRQRSGTNDRSAGLLARPPGLRFSR
jgi:toxin ParE1/3/4